MKNYGIILIIGVILLTLGVLYFNIKNQLKKFCFSGKIANLDLSTLQLAQGQNNIVVTFALIIFNRSNINLRVKNANFKIYYNGQLIGQNIEPITLEVNSDEVKEIQFQSDIFVTPEIISILTNYIGGGSFPITYSFEAFIYGIPFRKRGVTQISKNQQINNCV